MADLNGKQPIKTIDTTGADVVVKIGDGVETVAINGSNQMEVVEANSGSIQTAVELIDDAVYTDATGTPSKGIAVMGTDGTNPQLLAVDTSGHLQVDVLSGSGGTQYAEDTAHTTGDTGTMALVVRNDTLAALATTDGDYAPLQVNATGALYTAVDGTVTVTDDGSFTLAANSGVDIGDVTINNTEATAVPVYITSGISGNEKHDYDTASAVAASGTSNHDVTVTASTTAMLRQVICSASSNAKWEVQTGPVGSLATKFVGFSSPSNPVFDLTLAKAIEVDDASTGTIRIIRTNANTVSAQDLYSTIVYDEIAD